MRVLRSRPANLHRFIPAVCARMGAKVCEVPIKNIPRKVGKSNYGLKRKDWHAAPSVHPLCRCSMSDPINPEHWWIDKTGDMIHAYYREQYHIPEIAVACGSDLRAVTPREMLGLFLSIRSSAVSKDVWVPSAAGSAERQLPLTHSQAKRSRVGRTSLPPASCGRPCSSIQPMW